MKKTLHAKTRALLKLMKDHALNQSDVARLTGCSPNSVHYWLSEEPVVPDHRLNLLKFELAART